MEPSPNPRFKTERIDFPDTGDWWEIWRTLTVLRHRRFAAVALKTQALWRPEVEAADIPGLAAEMDEVVLDCTVRWSYGDVTIATLHNDDPAHHFEEAGGRMVTLYSPLVLAHIESLLSVSSSLSREPETNGSRSPASSQTPT